MARIARTLGVLVLAAGCLAAWFTGMARAADPITVEGLLKEGWEIAGYASSFDGRTLILFKHKERTYLTQCSVFYDVTRQNRVIINCYEVR
jgi:hypothetical protein